MLIKGLINKEEYKQALEIKNKEEREKEIAKWMLATWHSLAN